MNNLDTESTLPLLLWGLQEMQTVTLCVTGPSMRPTILSGDRVVLGKIHSNLVAGEIYFYLGRDNRPTIHRLLEVREVSGELEYVFKGDGAISADPPVKREDIRAQVLSIHSSRWKRILHFLRCDNSQNT